jgi:hypothetical protein
VRLWTELQVRCHVSVQARRDLLTGLQVRCLRTRRFIGAALEAARMTPKSN